MPPIIYCIKRIKTVSDEILRGKKHVLQLWHVVREFA
jgi:hypothetical protein